MFKPITLLLTEKELDQLRRLIARMPGYENATLDSAAQIVFTMGLREEVGSMNDRERKKEAA